MAKQELHGSFSGSQGTARTSAQKVEDHDEYKEFDKYMTTGRISSAIRCLSEDVKGGNLSTTEKVTVGGKTRTVLDFLHEKHPKSQPCNPAFIEQDPSNALPYHPQIFERKTLLASESRR